VHGHERRAVAAGARYPADELAPADCHVVDPCLLIICLFIAYLFVLLFIVAARRGLYEGLPNPTLDRIANGGRFFSEQPSHFLGLGKVPRPARRGSFNL
jgi:hypothetical protein